MFPSLFWRRITDEWLVSKAARVLFGFAAFVSLLLTFAGVFDMPQGELTFFVRLFFGILGVLGTLGAFFLWGGMWRYWMNIDSSSGWLRRVWFAVLLFGVWYGAILYFLVVYLPATVSGSFGRRSVE